MAWAHSRGAQYPIIISRDTEIPGSISLRRLHFVQLLLIDVDHMHGTCFKSPAWCLEFRGDRFWKFYIFLTVHLRIILVTDQLDAQFLL